jgi:molybdopterin-guanine dinucleotide biosynthesis protein A
MGPGPEKPLRLLAGRPLLFHVIARVAPQVSAMVLNANGDPARFAGFGLEVVADGVPDQPGPLAGILAGMRWAAARGMADVLSVPTDTPFLPDDLVVRLGAARRIAGVPIACAESGGTVHPVVGLWPVDLADRLEADILAGQRRVRAWAAMFGVASAVFEAGAPDPFFNINHQEDLVEAERILLK